MVLEGEIVWKEKNNIVSLIDSYSLQHTGSFQACIINVLLSFMHNNTGKDLQ